MADTVHPYQDRIDQAKKSVPGHRIDVAWQKNDATLEADAVRFWQELNALPTDVTPEQRLKELVCVAYDGDRVIGVGTAEVGVYAPLKHKFAFWRVLIHPDYRLHGMRVAVSHFVNTFFESWAAEHPEEGLAGVASVVSTTYPRPEGYRAVTRVSRAVTVGYNDLDQIVRVTWFDTVRV